MRQLNPPAIYLTKRAAADARCRARLERLLTKMSGPPVQEIDDAELAELIRHNSWNGTSPDLATDREGDPPLVFNRFRWDAMDENGRPTAACLGPGPSMFYGFCPWIEQRHEHVLESDGIECQTAYELHTLRGCPFRCQYCAYEYVLNVMLDLEEFGEHLTALMARSPQTLYKYDTASDILAFEPEYGAAAHVTELFGRHDRASLMHYTKSDNVEPLLGLKHNGRTIVCWTLSSHTVSRLLERDTATTEQRIEAARRCRRAGYRVRFRFSPVFPLHNWREEYRACVEMLFAKVQPEVISLLTLQHLPDYEDIFRLFDRRLLDPGYVAAAQEAQNDDDGARGERLPHWVREEIYGFMIEEVKRVSPETPVAICLDADETGEGPALPTDPYAHEYACCCGVHAAVGGPSA